MSKERIMSIELERVKSYWHDKLMTDWDPDSEFIEYLKKQVKENKYIPPVVVVKEKEDYLIVNGHHRCRALRELGKKEINCIVIEGTFEESEPLRKAEILLKEFDRKTEYRYQFSGYLDRWVASLEKKNYINKYKPTLSFQLYRLLKKWKKKIWQEKSGK